MNRAKREQVKRFSVIIPTLQESEELAHLLELYARHPRVGEILVVNNSKRPIEYSLPKLRVLQQAQNIYVNAAWNLGAAVASEEYLCISNDDIDFNPAIIDYAGKLLDRGKYSLAGPGRRALNGIDGPLSHRFSLGPYRPFGTLMFLPKAVYKPIPEGPLIWGGDDWLFWNRDLPAAEISGIAIRTEMSTTADQFRRTPLRENDAAWWQLERAKIETRHWHKRVERMRKLWKIRERVRRAIQIGTCRKIVKNRIG